jgi:hypothetical protein
MINIIGENMKIKLNNKKKKTHDIINDGSCRHT